MKHVLIVGISLAFGVGCSYLVFFLLGALGDSVIFTLGKVIIFSLIGALVFYIGNNIR